MRRLARRGGPLHPGHVRAAKHSHLAIAPALRRDPLHSVVAIVEIVAPGREDAVGVAATARVLDDEWIAVRGEAAGYADEVGTGVVVRGTNENGRCRSLVIREVDI